MSANTKQVEASKTLQVGDRSYNHLIEWFLDSKLGPTGRMSSVTTDGVVYNEDGDVRDDFDFYDATRTVTLYNVGGKRVATLPGLRQYEANAMAERWVEQGS